MKKLAGLLLALHLAACTGAPDKHSSSERDISNEPATTISSAAYSSSASSSLSPPDSLAGATAYEQLCVGCHGERGKSPIEIAIEGQSQIELSTIIHTTMPTQAAGGPDLCQDQCAADVAAYMLTWDSTPIEELGCNGTQQHTNTPLRLLTGQQLYNQIGDIFSGLTLDKLDALLKLGDDVAIAGFANNANTAISTEKLRKLLPAMEAVAVEITQKSENFAGCSASSNCFNQLFNKVRPTLFKGRLSNSRAQSIKSIANDNSVQSFTTAIIAMLMAPEFLYSYEEASSNRRLLSQWEIADKLALLIWQSAPDAALAEKVESNELSTTNAIAEEAARMLGDEKAYTGIRFFYQNWLSIKDNEEAANEIARFAFYLTKNGQTYGDLLESNISFLTNKSAESYGVNINNNDELFIDGRKTILPNERAGILTRTGYLLIGGHGEETKPTVRGSHFRKTLLCQGVPNPGPDIQSNFPILPSDPSLTEVEKLEQYHLKVEGCASCHNWLDPVGFGFEAFDSHGKYRTDYHLENGDIKPVHTQGEMVPMPGDPSDISGEFEGLIELSSKVATSQTAKECFAQMWFQNAMLRNPSDNDICVIEKINEDFKNENYALDGLIKAIVTSDAFRFRAPE